MSSRKAALGFILVTLFLDTIGLGLVAPVMPRLVEQLVGGGASEGAFYVGALLAAYAVMQFTFSPVLGSLSDRFGRRPVLLISLFGAAFNYLLLTFAPSIGWFFVGRLLAGLCGASVGTAAAYIADVSPPEKRAQNFGLIGMAFGLGFVAGPFLSAVLGGLELPLPDALAALVGQPGISGLRLPMLAAALASLANALWGVFVVPESLDLAHRRPFDLRRANPFGALTALAHYPAVGGLTLAFFFVGMAQRALESTWVLYTGHRFEWTHQQTSISLGVVGISTALVQGGLVRRVIPALGERKALVASLAVSMVAFTLYGAAPQGWMLYVILVFGALGAISGPAAQGLMSKAVPPSEQGLLQGGLASLTSVTSVFGPLLATNLFGYFISTRAPAQVPGIAFFVGSAFIALGLVVAVRTFRRLPVPLPGAAAVSPGGH